MSSGAGRNPRRSVRGRNAPKTSRTAPTTADPPPPPTMDPILKPEVVGESPQRCQHPYTSISLSPSKKHAVTASNDTLQLYEISPLGLKPLHSISCAPLFVASSPTPAGAARGGRPQQTSLLAWRGTASDGSGPSLTNVVINDVAWKGNDDFGSQSWIAAGGSNGVIILWNAALLYKHLTASANKAAPPPPPEAVLKQHIRAVNRIAWHPLDPATFLSASQDGTVRLWERKRKPKDGKNNSYQDGSSDSSEPTTNRLFQLPIFGGSSSMNQQQDSFVWTCTTVFEPKSEAVRDVAWNPFEPEIFGLVTAGGQLYVYHRRVKIRSLVKLTAHGREASSLDWHPRVPHIVATGGATDGSVKVWNLSKHLDAEQWNVVKPTGTMNTTTNINNIMANFASVGSRADSTQTDTSDNTDRSSPSYLQNRQTVLSVGTAGSNLGSRAVHVLSVAASVTRVRWRPSAGESFVPASGGSTEKKYFDDDWDDDPTEHPLQTDRHDALLAVSTAPVGWVSAGGAGTVGLWSCHRPFMALSVVEGHTEGAVVDFVWLETPLAKRTGSSQNMAGRLVTNTTPTANAFDRRVRKGEGNGSFRSLTSRRDEDGADNSEHSAAWMDTNDTVVGIWQHVLSVGKDGRCLVQSLMRGDRPLSRVPPSCFAMANLSPFQRGYGSLQLFTVCQPVPSGPLHDFLLTGLRKDSVTAEAPGMFRETPTEVELAAANERGVSSSSQWSAARRLPPRDPVMVFNVLDQGDLDNENLPLTDEPEAIIVAPEVVHFSRFAGSYLFRPTEHYPTRSSLCLHNSEVANDLNCPEVAHLWMTLASMLEGSGMDGLEDDTNRGVDNVMQFLILPTVKSMIEELAEQGDVQTCVAICEVLEVLHGDGTTKIQSLDINQVREWYLSYIDILRDMCLFSYASEIIQRCVDPYIADLNKTSTTIQESCPHCRKPMLQESDSTSQGSARRTCKNCRRRIGMCFLCHQPVKGVFVWCPGCGHGGHLEHALSWFGGLSGKAVRELCPTGCGHKCNRLQPISAFPRTESLRELE